MTDKSEDLEYRQSLLANLAHNEAGPRITGLYEWLISDEVTQEIVNRLMQETKAEAILENTDRQHPPKASTPEEVAGVGLLLMKKIQEGTDPWQLSHQYGIEPTYKSNSIQDCYESVFERFIDPAIDFVVRELKSIENVDSESILALSQNSASRAYPLEIHESLNRFLRDHPDIRRNAFVMMQFGGTDLHVKIVDAIRDTLVRYGITAHRADDKEYHDDLFGNVLTYIHGCSFGIAVFERLDDDDFNPNVSLEVGYLRALGSSVCLLKDRTLKTLQTDLIGKLYKAFDPQDPAGSIPDELEKWLCDKDIIKI